jgi:hypothetical protein
MLAVVNQRWYVLGSQSLDPLVRTDINEHLMCPTHSLCGAPWLVCVTLPQHRGCCLHFRD